MPCNYFNSSDNFCHICGEVTLRSQKMIITPLVKKADQLYFGCEIGDQDKGWVPHKCCKMCARILSKCQYHLPFLWYKGNLAIIYMIARFPLYHLFLEASEVDNNVSKYNSPLSDQFHTEKNIPYRTSETIFSLIQKMMSKGDQYHWIIMMSICQFWHVICTMHPLSRRTE